MKQFRFTLPLIQNLKKQFSHSAPSLYKKVFFRFIFGILLPLPGLGVFAYHSLYQVVLDKSIIYNRETLNQIKDNLDNYFGDFTHIYHFVFLDETIMHSLRTQPTYDKFYEYRIEARIREVFRNIIGLSPFISDIAILGNNHRVYSSDPSFIFQPGLFRKGLEASFAGVILNSQMVQKMGSQYQVITLLKPLKDYENGKSLGVLQINIHHHYIADILDSFNNASFGKVTLIGRTGKFILGEASVRRQVQAADLKILRQSGQAERVVWNRSGALLFYRKLENADWILVMSLSKDQVFGELNRIRNKIILFILGFLCLLPLIIILITKGISGPFHQLSLAMSKVREGNLMIRVNCTGSQEALQLSAGFNEMLEQINSLMVQIYVKEKSKYEAEMNALQAQMNPHFLYNTLNSIRWTAKLNHDEPVFTMTGHLIHLLQAILNQPKFISVADEIDNIRSYVKILKLRYMDNFAFEIADSPDVKDLLTLKLILQPLVENAVLHGLSPEVGGKVFIRVEVEGENLIMKVIDNGQGIEEERLHQLLTENGTFFKSKEIGLANVKERLKLTYGDEYGLEIQSKLGQGTTVILKQPVKKVVARTSEANHV